MRTAIVVSPVVSHPPLSGNSARVLQLTESLKKIGFRVIFVLCPIAVISDRRVGDTMYNLFEDDYYELEGGETTYGTWYQKLLGRLKDFFRLQSETASDFMFADGYITDNAKKEFHRLVQRTNPQAVICEYVLLSKLVQGLNPSIVKLVDTHDRFARRNQRIRDEGGQGLWWTLTAAQENKLLKRFDHIIAIQENEAQQFRNGFPSRAESIITLDIIEDAKRKGFTLSDDLVIGFIGSQNKHNQQGLLSYLQSHWLKIKHSVPQAKLHVAGAIYSDIASQNWDGVKFLGKVEHLADFYDQCRIVINPCLTGTGLKIKSVEALSYGKPLVATQEGAEGLSFMQGEGLFVKALSATDFADICISLLKQPTECSIYGNKAIKAISARYNNAIQKLSSITESKS